MSNGRFGAEDSALTVNADQLRLAGGRGHWLSWHRIALCYAVLMKKNGKRPGWPWAMMLLVSACSDGSDVANELPENMHTGRAGGTVGDATPESGMTYPVRIGQEGDRFRACGSVGRVLELGREDRLEVLAAPFRDAKVVDDLASGQSLFICTRSFDQKWLGVVYAGERQDPAECGVSSPIRIKRDYAGPCKSGWVSSAFVQLVAG